MHVTFKWLLTVAIFALAGAWLYSCTQLIPFHRHVKLADCTNSTLRFHLSVPKGAGFSLVLLSPEVEKGIVHVKGGPPYKFSGRVRISDRSPSVAEFFVSSDSALDACHWREGTNIHNGWRLTKHLSTNYPGLDRFLTPQGEYDVEMAFEQAPPPSESVWLRWSQTGKDKNK